MPRHAHLVLPHYPPHIMQRGHNRQAVFAQDADSLYDLATLQTWQTHDGVQVYALCLMTNHVHLLLQPADAPGALAHLMKRGAARQTRYVNRLERRTEPMWESR